VRNGALVLTGANGAITASSSFTVNHGATLRLENSAAANNGNRLRDASNVTLNGGTLHFANDGGAVSFSESAATLTIAQNACTVRSDPAGAGQTSTLTFAAFARTAGAAVNFTGESLGDPDGRNTIKLTGQAEGLIGPWATVNGTHLAAYSTARGVYASPEPAYDADIAARGPSSVILDAPTANVRINSDGVAGAIQLGSATTRILSLTQNTATDAIVDTAGKTFRTSGVIVPADKAAVTLGAAPGDGTLTALAAGGDVALHSGTASGGVTVNAVIANNTSASTLTKQGDGTAVLAAPNTFSGLTAIGGGSLLLAHPDALQNSTLAGPGAFFDAAAGSAFAVGGLTGSFPLRLENHAGAPIQLTLGRGNASASHNGVLSGLGGLTKTGTATQTLSGVNTFQGGVTVSQGTLSIGNAAALGTGPVINNGTLNLTAGGVTYTGLSGSLGGVGTVNVTLTTGAGTTYLHGDYSGFTGIWNLGVNAAANAAKAYMNGADNSAATINVLSNAALYCNGGTPHQAHLTLKGGNTGEPYGQLRLENNAVWAGPVTLAGPITSGEDGTVGGSGGTGYIRGDITDDGIPRPLYKIGPSTIELTGANTYRGQTWIRNGTLRVNALANIGAAASSLGAPETVANGTIKFGSYTTNTVLTYIGDGDETDRNLELAGTTGGATIDQSGTNLLTFTGEISSSAAGVKKLTLQGSKPTGAGEIAGVIADGVAGSSLTVIKAGSGTWTLSNANTFSGGITNGGGGTLVVAHPNALGTGGVGAFNGQTSIFDLAHDGTGATVHDWRVYDTANCTIRLGRGTDGPAITHAIGTAQLSGITLHVSNGLHVTSGTPTLTIDTVDLFGGNPDKVSTLIPSEADIIIGRAAIYSGNFANKTLKLDGTSTGNMILGSISNGLNTVKLTKSNTGTWTLCGSNVFSGATSVDNGRLILAGTDGALLGTGGITLNPSGTLVLQNDPDTNHTDRLSNTGTLTLKGGTLEFAHSGGAASYSETAGPLAVNVGSNTIFTARADEAQTSTLTFASLTRTGNGTVNFAGESLGTADARNRVLFTSAPALVNGLIGPWAMINGTTLATYDSGLGVTAYAGYTDIAARGPGSVIPNDAALNARISTPGVDGPITLGASPVSSVNTLLQDTETAAVVTVTNTAFQTSGILLAAGKAALTIGTEPGEGAIMPLDAGGSLTVVNHDPTALLTLNAPITNNTSASSLVKAGAGTVVLAGSNTFTGAIAINDGSLVFGGSVTQTVSNAISGPGTLVKSGSGCVTLNAANTFTGPTYINEGTFVARHNTAFGTTAAGTFIADGATLDIGGGLNVDALNLGAELFTVSGSGVDGQGAIVNNHANRQLNAFGRIVLAGDTTVGAIGRWDIRQNTPSVTLNGHTFTKIGPNELCLVNAQVYGSGHIVATQGLFRLEASTRLNGDAANTLTVKPGARLDLYSFTSATNASPWTVIFEPLSWITAGNSFHPYNTWWGPVTLNGTLFIDGSSGRSVTFSNAVSGAGGFIKNGTCEAFVFGDANTYAGTTTVSNGLLHIFQPGGLPGHQEGGHVTVGPSGTLVVYAAEDAGGWSKASIDDVRTNTLFTSATSSLGINTAWGDLVYDRDLTDAHAYSKYGRNTLTLPGKNLFGAALKVYNGTLTLPDTSTNAFSAAIVYGGAAGASLNIDGPASLGTGTLTAGGSGNDRSTVTISANASMARLLAGTTKGASGAVTQNGGAIQVGTTTGSGDVTTLGNAGGYGYYRMNNGTLKTGQLFLGGSTSGNNDGVFDLFSGTLNICVADGDLIIGFGYGNGQLNLFGGTLLNTNGNEIALGWESNRGVFSMLNLLGPEAYVLSAGRAVNVAKNSKNLAGVVNLNSGTLRALRVYASSSASPSYVNFNGGTLRADVSRTDFLQGLTAATVFSGGAVIDTTNANVTVNQPLLAPTGYGVASIPLRGQGLGYIGAPTVLISGGQGTGATAIATVDLNPSSPTCGQVTGLTVTSPGFGYASSDALTVTLRGGGYTNAAFAAAPLLAPNVSGGLTKLGSGTLTLGGASTYGGETVISNGTLKLGNALALPAASKVLLAGGTFDLGGYTVTNAVGGLGTIANGTLQTVISPAGEGALGAESLTVNGVALTGTYRCDVTETGANDHVTFAGSVGLSGLTLEIVDPESLSRSKVYTIATVTGARTGGFMLDSRLDSRWRLSYAADGTIKLLFVDGTFMFLK